MNDAIGRRGGYLRVGPEAAQVALQVSVGHELHHHQGGLAFRDHAQQTHLHTHTQTHTHAVEQARIVLHSNIYNWD